MVVTENLNLGRPRLVANGLDTFYEWFSRQFEAFKIC